MKFQLTKEEVARRDELVSRLRLAKEALNNKIFEYNEETSHRLDPILDSLESYNELVEEAHNFTIEIAAQMSADFEDKSDRWQESEDGEAVSAWIGEFEQFDADELDFDLPEDLPKFDPDHADDLDDLRASWED